MRDRCQSIKLLHLRAIAESSAYRRMLRYWHATFSPTILVVQKQQSVGSVCVCVCVFNAVFCTVSSFSYIIRIFGYFRDQTFEQISSLYSPWGPPWSPILPASIYRSPWVFLVVAVTQQDTCGPPCRPRRRSCWKWASPGR